MVSNTQDEQDQRQPGKKKSGIQPNRTTADDIQSTESKRPDVSSFAGAPLQWLRNLEHLGTPDDRQILVIGDSLSGLTLTVFLRRAGYDPVLIGGDRQPPTSGLTYLWPSTLRLLDFSNVSSTLRQHAVSPERMTVESLGQARSDGPLLSTEVNSTAPLLVPTLEIRKRLWHYLGEHQQVQSRRVESISRRNSALEVAFEDGVREWFDIVVETEEGCLDETRDTDLPSCRTLTQYETTVVRGDVAKRHMREFWSANAVIQVIPHPSRSAPLLRVTTPQTTPPGVLLDEVNETLASHVDLGDTETTSRVSVRQAVPETTVAPDWWGAGRIPASGTAALQVPPATGLQGTLAIEDAATLVDALLRGPSSVTAAVDRYTQRRSRRLTDLYRLSTDVTGDIEHLHPQNLSTSVSTLTRFRLATLAPFTQSNGQSPSRDFFQDEP
jgi:2-polyprenyl-6-methoxyphenol hydroxylase-like FAD-dependent oxidoreductase